MEQFPPRYPQMAAFYPLHHAASVRHVPRVFYTVRILEAADNAKGILSDGEFHRFDGACEANGR
jgi:hypothetical protein